jgi:hypothetical protein
MINKYLNDHKWYAGAALAGLCIVVIFILIAVPLTQSVFQGFSRAGLYRQRMALANGTTGAMDMAARDYLALGTACTTLSKHISGIDQFSIILEQLDQNAQETGVTMLSCHPQDRENEAQYMRQSIEILLEGGYHDLARFINLTESLESIVAIERLAFQTENIASAKVKAGMTICLYSKALPKE